MDGFVVILGQSAAGLPYFLLYALAGLLLVALFIAIYIHVTPHREFELVRQGNVAAAVSFGGAVVGFVIPLAQAISQSLNLLDMAVWALVALVVQLLVFGIATLLLGGVAKRIEAGNVAAAAFLAFMAVAGGILNAASMTYTG